jgi:hypothetical protein
VDAQTILMILLAIVGGYLSIPWETLRALFPKLPAKEPDAVKQIADTIRDMKVDPQSILQLLKGEAAPVDDVGQHVIALVQATRAKGDQAAMDLLMQFWAAFNHIDSPAS